MTKPSPVGLARGNADLTRECGRAEAVGLTDLFHVGIAIRDGAVKLAPQGGIKMNVLFRIVRDLMHLHIGQRGRHTWQKWRDRTWCSYCGKEIR